MSEDQDGAEARDGRRARRVEREARRTAHGAARAETRTAARLAEARERAARAGLTELEDLPPGFGPMWRTPAPGRRGPRPGLTVAAIAEAGVRVADAEGLPAVSMARVAEEVGVTTMALYRYVGGKDELVAAMYDAAMAAPEPDPGTGPWRDRLEAWCRAQLDRARRHPWLGETMPPAAFGPGRLAWIEAGLAALGDTALTRRERAAVVGHLSLHMLTELQLVAATARQSATGSADHPALVDYPALLSALADERHPAVLDALAAGAFGPATPATPAGMDRTGGPTAAHGTGDGVPAVAQEPFGLGLLLDGVAALVARAEGRATQTADPADG